MVAPVWSVTAKRDIKAAVVFIFIIIILSSIFWISLWAQITSGCLFPGEQDQTGYDDNAVENARGGSPSDEALPTCRKNCRAFISKQVAAK